MCNAYNTAVVGKYEYDELEIKKAFQITDIKIYDALRIMEKENPSFRNLGESHYQIGIDFFTSKSLYKIIS